MIDKLTPSTLDPKLTNGALVLTWLHHFMPGIKPSTYLEDSPLNDRMCDFVLDAYSTDSTGTQRICHEAAWISGKGSGKSYLAAFICLAELFGPVVPDGLAKKGDSFKVGDFEYFYAPGEVKGISMDQAGKTPSVKVIATSKEQVTRTLFNYIHLACGGMDASKSSLRLQEAYGIIPDKHVRLLSISSPMGGRIDVVSAENSSSLDGLKPTFCAFDESHRSIGQAAKSVEMLRAGLTKMDGWGAHFSTTFSRGEDSTLERFMELVEDIKADESLIDGILCHNNIPDPSLNLSDYDDLVTALEDQYYGSHWQNIGRIAQSFLDRRERPEELARLYLGVPSTPDYSFVTEEMLLKCATDRTELPPAGTKVALGLDVSFGRGSYSGSVMADCTVLCGVTVTDDETESYAFPIYTVVPDSKDWRLDSKALDSAIRQAFQTYDVVGMFADYSRIEALLASLENDFGDQVVARSKRNDPFRYNTGDRKRMAEALTHLEGSIHDGKLKIQRGILTEHLRNARRKANSSGFSIMKENPGSPKKIDAAVALTLAVDCCRLALLKGVLLPEEVELVKKTASRIMTPRYA